MHTDRILRGPVASALDAFARASGRTFEAREQTVGASEVGRCMRRTFFEKNEGGPYGTERDSDFVETWGARQRGTTFETAFWAPALGARFGAKLLYAGHAQVTLVSGFLSATCDGLLVGVERDILAPLGVPDIDADSLAVEAKTVDPRAVPALKPEHTFQLQTQLGLIRMQTEFRPEYGLISYTNSSFWDDTVEYAVRFDPAVFAAAQSRARRIMSAKSASELPPEGWIAGGREC